MTTRGMIMAMLAALAIADAGLAAAQDGGTAAGGPALDRLRAACVQGRGPGTDLLPVAERIARCTELSTRDGEAYTGLLNRARARQSVQDWAGAEADFTAALRAEPAGAEALFERGRVRLLYLGTPETALVDLDLAAQLAPERAEIHMLRALTATDLARRSDGDDLAALIAAARGAFTAYLALTEGTEDPAEQIQRDAAREVLDRLDKN